MGVRVARRIPGVAVGAALAAAASLGALALAAGAGAASGSPVPYAQLSLAAADEVATLTPGTWTPSGSGCDQPADLPAISGPVALEQGSGGDAVFVFRRSGNSHAFTGPVTTGAGGSLVLHLSFVAASTDQRVTLTGSGSSFSGPATVAVPSCTWSTTATFTLSGGGLVLASSTTTSTTTTTLAPAGSLAPVGTDLGGLDVAQYCASTGGGTAVLSKGGITGNDFAYDNWKCSSAGATLSMQKVCQWTYGSRAAYVVARAADSGNAYSWQCYAAAKPTPAGRAVRAGDIAPIAATISTPGEVFHSWGHDLVNAIITVAVILFIAFPAMIFNQTFSENYGEILLMVERARRRLRRLVGMGASSAGSPAPSTEDPEAPAPVAAGPAAAASAAAAPASWSPDRASRPWFAATLVVGAILGGLLNPAFGANARTLENFLATLLAFAFGAVVSWYVAVRFRHWHQYPTGTYLRALPFGLLVAAMCVLVSRLTHFEPGYLYGVVAGVGFVESMKDRHNAHLVAISSLSTLAVALLAWLVWVPVNHLALEHSHEVLLVIVDDVLGSIFVGGLVGTVIGLLPLEGLPGGHLTKWRRDVWAGVFFVAVFLLVEVELRPASGPTHPGGAPVVTAIVLFVIFGALSFGFREFFARRKRRASPSTPAASESR